jgi:2-polyprenyl-3-methyl-5-hydroxy-6-metoxy-1,4-benzoquinol methylase
MKTNFKGAQEFSIKGIAHKEKSGIESASGSGSSMHATEHTRQFISDTINEYDIESVLDLGCGDFNWFSSIIKEYPELNYTGWDAGSDLVEILNNANPQDNVNFYVKDIVTEEYPDVDLIVCRDVLFHMRDEIATTVVNKVKESSATYFLSTCYPTLNNNKNFKEIYGPDWVWRTINLNQAPFDLHDFRINEIKEENIQAEGEHYRYMTLYEL